MTIAEREGRIIVHCKVSDSQSSLSSEAFTTVTQVRKLRMTEAATPNNVG